MNPMNYLFAAFLAIWIIMACYLFSIHSREKKLREEVRRLRQRMDKTGSYESGYSNGGFARHSGCRTPGALHAYKSNPDRAVGPIHCRPSGPAALP